MDRTKEIGANEGRGVRAGLLRGVATAICAAALAAVAFADQGHDHQASGPSIIDGILVGLPNFVPGDSPQTPRIMYRDSLISVNNYCPVRKARLDPNRKPVYVNDRPVGFCCTPCPVTFSMDPERYLKEMQVSFRCPVRPTRLATIDSSLRERINQDIFFFSNVAALKQFRKNPLRYVGALTDPVSFERFKPTKDSPHVVFRDRAYYFASDSTKIRFQAEPEHWFERKTVH